MNKSRLIWGIICLTLAAFLGVLNFALPPEDFMFAVGDENMPFVPPIILGILGIFLLVTAFRGREVMDEGQQDEIIQDPEKATLNRRLERIGWGFFLVMLGGFILVPGDQVNKGLWSIGVGVIMLGLNAARYLNGIKMSGFTTFLGIISLTGGILQLAGMNMLEGAILLIILGVYLLLKPYFDKQQLFGKAKES